MPNNAESSCHGKTKHKTYSIAKKVLKLNKLERVRRSGGHVYHCEHCKFYHIGTHVHLKVVKREKIERALVRDQEIAQDNVWRYQRAG